MKLSVFYGHVKEAAEQQGVSIGEMLDYVKSIGVDYIEVIRDFDMLEEGITAEEMRDLLAAHDLKVSNVCGYFDFAVKPDDFRGFGQIYDALTMGCHSIMPIPGLLTGNEETKEQEIRQMIEGEKVVVAKAAELGVQCVIEPYDNVLSPVMSAEGMRYFADNVPNLKFALDSGNLDFCCEKIEDEYPRMKDKIAHVHLKDRSETPDGIQKPGHRTDGSEIYGCAVGDGVVNVKWFVRKMVESGYDGCYAIEHFGMPDQKKAITDSVRNIKAML